MGKFSEAYWSASDVVLYHGEARAILRRLPARSVHCMITSPPYWRLRHYLEENHDYKNMEIGSETYYDCGTQGQKQCGDCYVCSIVSVMREVYRVLRDDGTAWLNIGDTFDNGQLLIPSRVALSLMDDGWKLVQDIIWHSPDKMPESVTNRCTKSHEHIFLLSKSDDYYFDHIAIQSKKTDGKGAVSNKRDVWSVPTANHSGAHFAVFNPKLIEPCFLASTSRYGCCADCGKQYRRVVRTERAESRVSSGGNCFGRQHSNPQAKGAQSSSNYREIINQETIGWCKPCACATDSVTRPVVLDPFIGSGTVAVTAREHGCSAVGIDLSREFLDRDAIPRITVAPQTLARETVVIDSGGTPLPVRKLSS